MREHPKDGPAGYTATNGHFIETPALAELPDANFDEERFRDAATHAARYAADHAFAREFALIEGAVGAATSGVKWIAGLAGNLGDPRKQHFTEEVLFEARRKRRAEVNTRVDALLGSLKRPETSFEFARRLSDVIGYPATQYANAYQTYMQAENRWAIELIDALPPARLAPALSGLVRPWLFDPHRTWFFEPALKRFLESPHGDLRHLDGDVPAGEPARLDLGFDPARFMSGQMSMGDMIKAARTLQAAVRARQAADETRGQDVSQHLGVTVTNADVDAMGEVGTDLLHRSRERQRFGWPPAGVFLVEGLRRGLTPRADALPDRVWAAYIAEHGTLLDRALGLSGSAPAKQAFEARHTMALLRKLPRLPQRAKDTVFRTALGKKKKAGRADAQRLLRGTPGLVGRLAKEGRKRALDTRLQATACLGFAGDAAAIPALEDMFDREATRKGQNAILAALLRLGADTTGYSPNLGALIAEAEAVFETPYPAKLRWLADLELPDLTLNNGTTAPVTLAPWLVRLAAELGLPEGGPLLDLRLAHLTKSSRSALGEAALGAFYGHDTLRWADMAVPDKRPRLIERMYREYVEFFDWESEWVAQHDQARSKRRRNKQTWEAFRDGITEARISKFLSEKNKWEPYVQSAHDARGILGLARALTAAKVKPMLRAYLGPHVKRNAQAKAVMSLFASFKGKPVIAELTRVARDQEQKGLRTHAMDLLEDLGAPYLPEPPEDESEARDFL